MTLGEAALREPCDEQGNDDTCDCFFHTLMFQTPAYSAKIEIQINARLELHHWPNPAHRGMKIGRERINRELPHFSGIGLYQSTQLETYP
jgi:hypothetical protein